MGRRRATEKDFNDMLIDRGGDLTIFFSKIKKDEKAIIPLQNSKTKSIDIHATKLTKAVYNLSNEENALLSKLSNSKTKELE